MATQSVSQLASQPARQAVSKSRKGDFRLKTKGKQGKKEDTSKGKVIRFERKTKKHKKTKLAGCPAGWLAAWPIGWPSGGGRRKATRETPGETPGGDSWCGPIGYQAEARSFMLKNERKKNKETTRKNKETVTSFVRQIKKYKKHEILAPPNQPAY